MSDATRAFEIGGNLYFTLDAGEAEMPTALKLLSHDHLVVVMVVAEAAGQPAAARCCRTA